MPKSITVQAEFPSIDRAERAAFLVRRRCDKVESIKLFSHRRERPRPPAMGALILNEGINQIEPHGMEQGMTDYPPYLFSAHWEERRGGEDYGCKVAVTVPESSRSAVEAALINSGGSSVRAR